MVYFECDTCNQTLKKKQVLPHYTTVCRRSNLFSCLTCFNRFDRETIVPHTSCVTEEEKYTKGCMKAQELTKKKENMVHLHHLKDNIDELDFGKVSWKGFRKTTKEILTMINVKKILISRLINELLKIYSVHKKVEVNEIDEDKLKHELMERLEDYQEVTVDLSKKIIRLKMKNNI